MKYNGNMLLVANWESSVGYAWQLIENFWITIAGNLQTKNIESVLIYPKITKVPSFIDNSNIHIIEHNFWSASTPDLKGLKKIIINNNIQYIYLTDSPSYSWRYLLLRWWGVKKIIIHDHTPGERACSTGLKRLIKSAVQRIPYFTADHFVAVTEFVYKRFLEVSCIPKKKCSCAPNGIEPIDLENADFNYAQKTFNIPKDKIIVITTGRATYYKGIDFFIKCAYELINNQHHKQYHFLYCGDGPNLEEFKALVNAYSLESHFTFAGRRNDVRKILPSCHIGFHASLGEVGYSLSILEYMSAGLFTIVPNTPSTSLATIENETGVTYMPNNIEAAISAILNYSKHNDNNPRTLGKQAALYIENNKNIADTNKTINQIINSALFN